MGNVASYMECVGQDGSGGLGAAIVPLFDTFLRKLQFCVHVLEDLNPILRIFITVLKIQGASVHKVEKSNTYLAKFMCVTI